MASADCPCFLPVINCVKMHPNLSVCRQKMIFFSGEVSSPSTTPHPSTLTAPRPSLLKSQIRHWSTVKTNRASRWKKNEMCDKPDVSVMSILTMTEMTTTTAAANMSDVTTRRLTHLYTDATRALMRTQTLYQGQNMIQDSNPEFRTRSGSGYLPNCFQHVLDSFSCRHQYQFCQVPQKSAGNYMRNANKSPKIPHSAMVKEVEKWSGIRIWDRITSKS